MNEIWYGAITGGIAGGLAGLAAQIIRKKIADPKKSKSTGAIVFVVLFFTIRGIFALPEVVNTFAGMFDKHHAVKQTLYTKMQPLIELPEVKSHLEANPSEAQTYMQKLVHDGLKRMDLAGLETWNRLRRKMINSSPGLCAGLWTGKVDENTLFDSLASFSEKEMDEWVNFSIAAAKKELNQDEVPIITALDFQAGVKKIMTDRPEEDRKRLEKVFAGGTSVGDEDACWAMKTLLDVDKLEGAEKEKYLRYVSML
ncbi:MAG: hypothetical protein V4598_05605 [Bdellovibrionota bacterium]